MAAASPRSPVLPDNLVVFPVPFYTVRRKMRICGASQGGAGMIGSGLTERGRGAFAARLRRMAVATVLSAPLLAPFPGSGVAQQPAGALPDALAAAYAAFDAAWSQAPLTLAVATFVEGDVAGFGRYTPRAEAVFAEGEAITVYTQPVGFGYVETDAGYGVRLVADFELLNTSGQVLASQTGFAELAADSRDRLREFHATLRFAFDGLRAGDYSLVARLTDTASGKIADVTLPFKVRAAN